MEILTEILLLYLETFARCRVFLVFANRAKHVANLHRAVLRDDVLLQTGECLVQPLVLLGDHHVLPIPWQIVQGVRWLVRAKLAASLNKRDLRAGWGAGRAVNFHHGSILAEVSLVHGLLPWLLWLAHVVINSRDRGSVHEDTATSLLWRGDVLV